MLEIKSKFHYIIMGAGRCIFLILLEIKSKFQHIIMAEYISYYCLKLDQNFNIEIFLVFF